MIEAPEMVITIHKPLIGLSQAVAARDHMDKKRHFFEIILFPKHPPQGNKTPSIWQDGNRLLIENQLVTIFSKDNGQDRLVFQKIPVLPDMERK